MTLEYYPPPTPGGYMSNMILEKSREIPPENMKRLNQNKKDTQLWMCPMVKVKSNAVKNNIA